MFVGHEYYLQRDEAIDPEKAIRSRIKLNKLPLEKFAEVVTKAGRTNAERTNDAIASADSQSFYAAHPEFLPTANNTRIVNHWLKTQGIDNPTFPDFEAAYDA